MFDFSGGELQGKRSLLYVQLKLVECEISTI
jgi:hypothetical protein